MSKDILVNGNYYFFTKIGMHAGDSIHDILNRKEADVQEHGYCLWSGRLPMVKRNDLKEALESQSEVYVLCVATNSTATTNDSARDKVIHAKSYKNFDGSEVDLSEGPSSTYTRNAESGRTANNKAFVITEIVETSFQVNMGDFEYIYSDPKKPNGDATKALGAQNSNGVIRYLPSEAAEGKTYEVVSIFKLKKPYVAELA